MNKKRAAITLSIFAMTIALVQPAAATEADVRFARGRVLFNKGNFDAALAEFAAAYQITPSPILRYSIGVVHAAMGRPVEAVEAFEECLTLASTPESALTKEQRARADAELEKQQELVGAIVAITNPPVAVVEIDNLPNSVITPHPKPIRVKSGTRVVSAFATGYAQARKSVVVAGGQVQQVHLDLVPLQATPVDLTITTQLPGVEVFIDGERVGVTPLLHKPKVAPGPHRIDLQRAGYQSIHRDLPISEGAGAMVNYDLEEDATWVAANGGFLALRFSETHPMITVDGVSRGEYRGNLQLAPGVHRLRAERAGFVAVQRDVEVTTRKTTEAFIRFEPTPETLVKFAEHVEWRRNWGIGLTVGGVILGGVGAGVMRFYFVQSEKDCPFGAAGEGSCDGDKIGIGLGAAGLGLGATTVITGVVLIARNEDPHRYDAKPSGQNLAQSCVVPMIWPSGNGAMVGMIGVF